MSEFPIDPRSVASDPNDGTPILLGMMYMAAQAVDALGATNYLRKYEVQPLPPYEPPDAPSHFDIVMETGTYRVSIEKVVAT